MGARHMNDDEDDPQPLPPQRLMLSDVVALILQVVRSLFGTLASGFDAAADLAKCHSNAVADEREFVTEGNADIRSIMRGTV